MAYYYASHESLVKSGIGLPSKLPPEKFNSFLYNMYSYIPYSSIFTFFIFTSRLIIISSRNILTIWAAIELNLLSIIPLITINKSKLETEAAVKYFLAQALGSGLILISYITTLYNPESITMFNSSIITLTLGFLTKLGAAPIHFWFPSVISSLPWPICILLATWQKLAPLLIILQLITPSNILLIIARALRAIVGGIIGINQTQLPRLIAYSSIGHLGWILGASFISNSYRSLYFLIYCLTSGSLIILLYILNLYTIKQFPSTHPLHPKTTLSISILLLSLGGLPPLLGFAPKLIVIFSLINYSSPIILIPLIVGSTINLSYYLIIAFNTIINASSPHNTYQNQQISPNIILYSTIPLFILPYLI